MKKGIAIYGIIALVVVAYLVFYGRAFTSDATHEDFEQLEIGMTKWQVRRTIGLWPDKSYVLLKGQTHENWYADGGMIVLEFDDQNRLIWKTWIDGMSRPPFLERIGWHRVLDG